MKRLIVIIGLFLAVVLVLASCSSAKESIAHGTPTTPAATPTTPTTPTVPMPPSVITTPAPAEAAKAGGATTLPSVTQDRMIVRNGDMSLIVKNVVDARDEIAQLAVGLGGWVVSSWITGDGEEMRGNISIRVPDEKFEPALVELRKLAVRVDSESTNSQDVTEQYTDLEARLKNAEATEKQYLALLDKATDVEDMLKIQDSLSQVRAQIEQIKGQMLYLERTSSMSLITAQLQPAVSAKPLTPVGWSALETLKAAVRGIITFGKWLANIAIWLVIFIPIWGTIAGIIYWLRRRRKKPQ